MVREAPVKNTDETSWKKGDKRWLWSAATATVALFVIHLRRNFAGLQALLGQTITGIVCSDRWSVYNKLPLNLCGESAGLDLKRDFQKLVDRGGPAEAIGRVGLDVVECLFADWWAFRRGELDRPGLQTRLDPIVRELQGVLEQGCPARIPRQRPFAPDLGTVSGVVVVRLDRRCRAHEQPCGTHPSACYGGRTPLVATARRGVGLWSGC